MKTLKISEETHKKLKIVHSWTNNKTFDQTINELIELNPIYQLKQYISNKAKNNDK